MEDIDVKIHIIYDIACFNFKQWMGDWRVKKEVTLTAVVLLKFTNGLKGNKDKYV